MIEDSYQDACRNVRHDIEQANFDLISSDPRSYLTRTIDDDWERAISTAMRTYISDQLRYFKSDYVPIYAMNTMELLGKTMVEDIVPLQTVTGEQTEIDAEWTKAQIGARQLLDVLALDAPSQEQIAKAQNMTLVALNTYRWMREEQCLNKRQIYSEPWPQMLEHLFDEATKDNPQVLGTSQAGFKWNHALRATYAQTHNLAKANPKSPVTRDACEQRQALTRAALGRLAPQGQQPQGGLYDEVTRQLDLIDNDRGTVEDHTPHEGDHQAFIITVPLVSLLAVQSRMP